MLLALPAYRWVMFYILKGLYLAYKIRKHEKKIRVCTELREKLKKRQKKYSDKYELYLEKEKEHLARK
jgi:hypothetical protein